MVAFARPEDCRRHRRKKKERDGEKKEQKKWEGGLKRQRQPRVVCNCRMASPHNSAKVAFHGLLIPVCSGHHSRALPPKLVQNWKCLGPTGISRKQGPERWRAGVGSSYTVRCPPLSVPALFLLSPMCPQTLFSSFHFVCLQGHKGITGPLGPPGPKGEKVGVASLSSS